MSFGRSASGPGGLTLNTGAANSLFGSTASSQLPAPGGSFASSTPSSQPTTNLFGSSTATSQPRQTGGGLIGSGATQGGSLFGGTNTSQPQQGGSLFGTTTNQPQQQQQQQQQQPQQGGGLFGSSTAAQPQSGGGLFGGATQQQPHQSGGLFGGNTQNQPQQGGGLFGSQNQQQNQQSSGLFGGSNQQQQGQQGGGLFGGASTNKPAMNLFQTSTSQGQQNQNPRPSLFPGLATATNINNQQRPSLFGTSFPTAASNPNTSQNATLGGSSIGGQNGPLGGILGSTLQQQTVPGVKIDLANVRGTTRFSDLHEDLQKQIEKLDNEILRQMETQKKVEAIMPGHEQSLAYIPNDVEFVSRRLATMQHALENDAQAIDHVRRSVRRDYHDAQLSFRALNNLKLPPQYQYTGLWSGPGAPAQVAPQSAAGSGGLDDEEEGSTDLVAYFSRQADEMAQTLEKFKRNLREIEDGLRGVEAKTVQQTQRLMLTQGEDGRNRSEEEQIGELSAVLRYFEDGILSVAGNVGVAREKVLDVTTGDVGGLRVKRRTGIY